MVFKNKVATLFATSIAAIGGILYGYDLGIIGLALDYLKECVKLSDGQTGFIVGAVMAGSLLASVVGGGLADWIGRRRTLMLSAVLFVASVALIFFSQGYSSLLAGRVLQGLSAGMIGVVVPLFMAEAAPSKIRGSTATVFQLCICLGYAISMGAGKWYQVGAEEAIRAAAGDADKIFAIRDHAWRMMFLSSAYPAVFFFAAALLVSESPHWLFKKGREAETQAVLEKTRGAEEARREFSEMRELAHAARERRNSAAGDSIFQMRYMVPLVLAVALMGINQATGINSVLPYMALMLRQSGITQETAGTLALIGTCFLVVPTIFGVLLVDKLGRKRLLQIGTGLIVAALLVGLFTYWKTERSNHDVTAELRHDVKDHALSLPVAADGAVPMQVSVSYAYDGREQTTLVRSDDAKPVLRLERDAKADKPDAKLEILHARRGPAPSATDGWTIFACIVVYLVGFCFGPGVCLWLMSAEILPTRVRSIGMGVGVLANAGVSFVFSYIFLPVVGNFGYAAIWGVFAACSLGYFLFATFALPETKGKTLEEIEAQFAEGKP